ncbi:MULTISPECIES: HAMP domain-containing sensor histidine kinase [unclassified Streptomyces]|uniref:sensor histidine kinase n=1 Tax=unclassified Streptomyces TaxID=2593676 RepID=UPI00225AB57C|nr:MULTISPECIES: HAMP domain-containing sensor histidine kinase [unclassified Streptomyces]MCX4393854.1 HAMP domain-containing histidine kinase [Streptomyces sp. NBC_01767]WSC27615.1 HAMP domain-containing histidine kinase [Streptomyces sp. NBC_01768]WSP46515.1 HAMP domain-containing histidine kinase [Streptomyces sp. NBC_01243]
MRSVRARAALGATVVVALALIGAGLSVLLVLRANLTDQAGLQAEVVAREVAGQLALDVPYDRLETRDEEDHPVQVTDEDGRVVAVSKDLRAISGTGTDRVTPDPSPTAGGSGGGSGDDNGGDDNGRDDGSDDDDRATPAPGRGEVDSGEPDFGNGTATVDGETADYRFASVQATTPAGVTLTVHAGAPLAAEQEAVGTVRGAMLIGLPLLLLVVAGVTWLVTRRALRPVEGIRREMAAITASEDLSRRVPEPGSRDEVARLARTTNETLTALEASVERQRRFVADASHELRSPIASLRTQLEVGAAHPELLDVPGAVADTVRLQALAADLLLLARLDAGERPGRTALDLGALVREEVSQRGGDRIPVTVSVPDSGEFEVAGSRGQLARVIGNLLDNAQRHARSAVTVSVRTAERGDVVVAVTDDGAGVPPQERERIFERFVRLDDARTRDDGGAGLGLAIARDVAARHGGRLTVGDAREGGARFVLRLPGTG